MHGNGRWQVSRAAFYGAVLFLREGKPGAGEGVARNTGRSGLKRSRGAVFSLLLCSRKEKKSPF